MSAFPEITIVRHGETAWSLSGQHTGRSDIPLTENGEAAARALAPRLSGLSVSAVWSSPSQRARNTCALAGFGEGAIIKADLAEWDYGAYEGITTKEILSKRPGWRLFRDGCPDGEAASDVGAASASLGRAHLPRRSVASSLCSRWCHASLGCRPTAGGNAGRGHPYQVDPELGG